MIDFSIPPELADARQRTTAFMEEFVYPNESKLVEDEGLPAGLESELQARVKSLGLWAPNLPREWGGMGIGFIGQALINEIVGRSVIAPRLFGNAAPDAGNAELLLIAATTEQKENFLRPLAEGAVRSCFAMTEPEVSGSDPTGLRTTAVRAGGDWVINGHKWFTSGAIGSSFAIVMAVTEPDADAHQRASMILVPTATPGFEIVRAVPVMGSGGLGGHCEVRFENCRVPLANLLGEAGKGFKLAQVRLGPGRIQHCMRWLGAAQRSFEMMCSYALERKTFGEPLAKKQTVQNWIADSAAELHAARLMTLNAAWKLDRGDDARVEISLIKFFGARVLHDVVDRAIQVHGALGYSRDTPLEMFYRDARAARIYDGPDEVHRQVVAQRILKTFARNVE
ncbi:MAG: acyl-CoA dehydrogenase [Pyrinomonadaceae bacterium]|jgi:alkylation response protein AidB-like acyl-CoA dehydrogenase|nr:acyl-CoA dehydrogenase [Pyrinomonadaceae bacterium]